MAGKAIPEITIDGNPFGPITQLTLDQPWNGHHSFSLIAPFREKLDSLMQLSKDYVGKPMSIHLRGGIREQRGELLFKGVITNVKLSKHESARMQLILQGFSPTRMMDDGPHNETFTEKKLADIVKTIAGEYAELDTKVDVQYTEVLPYVTRYKETAFRFLHRLLATHGEWFYYDGEKAVFGRPPEGEEVELTFGRDMTGLDISADIVPADFKLLGYDYIGDKHYDSTASKAKVRELDDLTKLMLDTSGQLFPTEPTFFEPFVLTEKSQLEAQVLRRKSGRSAQLVNLFGQSSRMDLKLGQVITVKALGDTLGLVGMEAAHYGSFRLLHVTHHCDGQGNYDNSFQAIPAGLEMPPVNDEVIRPPLAEPQPAEVTDNKDPEKLGRVKVKFPWQKDSGETTPWLRVAAAGAGGGHGAYFVPETGDQVLVGFAYNNPDHPVIYGSLYHGKVKPPNAADPDNNSKIIRTRSGQEIKLSDEGGKEAIILTNGSNVITMSLDGSTTISIVTTGDLSLDANNITISAKGNLTMSAGGVLSAKGAEPSMIEGTGGLTLKTGAKLLADGKEVEVKATTTLKAGGGSSADLTSPKTTVNGDASVTVSSMMIKLN